MSSVDADQQRAVRAALRFDSESQTRRRYRTAAVVLVGLNLLVVPVLALLGHPRGAVLWLGAWLGAITLVRLQRPDGSWIAARSRLFDVAFGLGLVLVLVSLSGYAVLQRR